MPCAGGITAKAAPYIPQPLHAQFQRTMRGAILTWGDRHSTHVTTDSPLGWTVHRESFDEAHLALVRDLPGVGIEAERQCWVAPSGPSGAMHRDVEDVGERRVGERIRGCVRYGAGHVRPDGHRFRVEMAKP